VSLWLSSAIPYRSTWRRCAGSPPDLGVLTPPRRPAAALFGTLLLGQPLRAIPLAGIA